MKQATANWFIGLCCLMGEEGIDFVLHETMDRLGDRIGMPSPYRNLN